MDIPTQLLLPECTSNLCRYRWDARMMWQHVISDALGIFGISLHKDCNA
jgi:hypothetical protein